MSDQPPSSFLDKIRKRTFDSSAEISHKRRKVESLYEKIIPVMVEILLIKYVGYLFDKIEQASKLGQNKVRLLIYEDFEGMTVGLDLVRPIFSEFVRILTSDPKLFKGFHVKLGKITMKNTKFYTLSVYGVKTPVPKYFMDMTWKLDETDAELDMCDYDNHNEDDNIIIVSSNDVSSHREAEINESAQTLASLAFGPVNSTEPELSSSSTIPTSIRIDDVAKNKKNTKNSNDPVV